MAYPLDVQSEELIAPPAKAAGATVTLDGIGLNLPPWDFYRRWGTERVEREPGPAASSWWRHTSGTTAAFSTRSRQKDATTAYDA